jgi:surface protein
MKSLQHFSYPPSPLRRKIDNERGAIDLASIMVGIIVIGLIGSVIAATIFAVIPWAQDNATKQQLDNIVTAENAYMGYSSVTPSMLIAGARTNSYGSSNELEVANVLRQSKNYCVIATPDGKGYDAYAKSASKKVFTVTNANTKPQLYSSSLPVQCEFITSSTGVGGSEFENTPTVPPPYVDPTPKLTALTYKCDTTTTGTIPLQNTLVGTETWSDGVTRTYSGNNLPTNKTLQAGVEYKVTFNGTYKYFISTYLTPCLRSLDHWGTGTGVVYAGNAFFGVTDLQYVPDHVPDTLTDMSYMFTGVTNFSSPNVSKWDVSKVTNMSNMFDGASNFNEPLNSWDVSKVTNMDSMFANTFMFSQDLSGWNTSSLTTSSNFAPNLFPKPYLPPKVAAT